MFKKLGGVPRPLRNLLYAGPVLTLAVQRLHPDAQLPRYAHDGPFGDLAADLYSIAPATLAPHAATVVPTGLAIAFPEDYGALIEDRSGLAMRGITTLAGVIDPGYRGELRVVLFNVTESAVTLAAGDRIAQLRLVRRIAAQFVAVASLEAAALPAAAGSAPVSLPASLAGSTTVSPVRSGNGFGSTGMR